MKCVPYLIIGLLFIHGCREEKKPFSICFTGDVLLDRGVRGRIEKKGIDYLFEDAGPVFRKADAVIINLECPVTTIRSPINKKYIFRGEPAWLETLKKNGITHANLANNHSIDQGREGLSSTARNLEEAGLIPVGYGINKVEACRPVIISAPECDIYLFSSVWVPLENWPYLDDRPGVCQMGEQEVKEAVGQLKKNKPDAFVVVNLHWGSEFRSQPAGRQRKQAYSLIDAGADLIIGHHPHVLQPEEVYKEKFIFYSLGNFIFDQHSPGTCESLIVELIFSGKEVEVKKHPVSIKEGKPVLK